MFLAPRPWDCERPRAIECDGSELVGREDVTGLVQLAHEDECLEQVTDLEPHARLEEELAVVCVSAPQVRERRRRITQ